MLRRKKSPRHGMARLRVGLWRNNTLWKPSSRGLHGFRGHLKAIENQSEQEDLAPSCTIHSSPDGDGPSSRSLEYKSDLPIASSK